MNYFIPLVTIISLANANLIGHMDGMGGLFGQETMTGSIQDPNMMHNQGIMRNGVMMGRYNMRGVTPDTTGMASSGLCNSLCGSQVMKQDFNQMSYDMIEEAQQKQMMQLLGRLQENNDQSGSNMVDMKAMTESADKMAEQITQQARQAEEVQMQQIFQDIQQQFGKNTMTGHGSTMVQRMAQQEATEQLKQIMMQYQGSTKVSQHIQSTLRVAIIAQMVMKNMQMQHSSKMPTMFGEYMMQHFQNQAMQMLEQKRMLDTEALLMEHEMQIKQGQLNLQFLNDQMQQMSMYQLSMIQEKANMQVSESMQQIRQQMHQQHEQLLAQQLAQQMIVTCLQQVLRSQQKIMQEMMFQQSQMQMMNPTMSMSSMRMMPKMMQA